MLSLSSKKGNAMENSYTIFLCLVLYITFLSNMREELWKFGLWQDDTETIWKTGKVYLKVLEYISTRIVYQTEWSI